MKNDLPTLATLLLGGGLLFWLVRRMQKDKALQDFDERDVDHMARTLWVETALRHGDDELSQITWVAINRAKKYKKPVADLVHPDARPTWFGRINDANRARWYAFEDNPRFEETKEFVRNIFLGNSYPSQIGDRIQFLHPGGMPRCDGEPGSSCSPRRICTETSFGKRCLPKWSVEPYASVVNIGKARFS